MAFNAIHINTGIQNNDYATSIILRTHRYGQFGNSYAYIWDEASLNSIKSLRLELDATQAHSISFTVPRLDCWGYNTATKQTDILFEMNTITRVHEKKLYNGALVSDTVIAEKESGATSIPAHNDDVWYSDGISAALRGLKITEQAGAYDYFNEIYTIFPAISKADANYSNKTITFITTQLSNLDVASGYSFLYEMESFATPINNNGMISLYVLNYLYHDETNTIDGNHFSLGKYVRYSTNDMPIISPAEHIYIKASFICKDKSVDSSGGAFLMKGREYNCYDLLRRALLTIDTHLIDNNIQGLDDWDSNGNSQPSLEHPIIVDERWKQRLKNATMMETIFEGKNLWEVLIQIGYYLHAIPYLEFASDGTDRFVLNFRQLGDTRIKSDSSIKCTIFNSRALSDYFTQFDSYVTNLYSPQNIVSEWTVAQTTDTTYLVSNDTAEIITSRPISEIIKFEIMLNGIVKDATQYIFEGSVYQVLTSDNPIQVTPAKGNSIYYNLGDNKIQGLQYVAPAVNSGTYPYSLQEICRRLFGGEPPSIWGDIVQGDVHNLKYNDLAFHITYRTQDSIRLRQTRPDIENFVKNSEYEQYPHHEQFYGQQDKIVDSERFTLNLWGKLVRMGNNLYQCDEYCKNVQDVKQTGDLVLIDNEPYYVTAIDNEFYQDIILQKVTYTKNFNQLANIVTIPSEPRFYEVSERSKITREVSIIDFIKMSTELDELDSNNRKSLRFMDGATMQKLLKTIVFNKENSFVLPSYAYTKFKADYKRNHKGSYGQYVAPDKLFPSDETERIGSNVVVPKQPSDHADNITKVLHFPLHDGIVFEWDMVDNFKVGDSIDTSVNGSADTANKAYYALAPARYVDVMGRADLFEFKLFDKTDWTFSEIQKLPKATSVPSNSVVQTPSGLSIALDKDNREQLSFNYQVSLLHSADRNIDDFITFPNLFGVKDSDLRMCLLNQRQSMFNENIDLSGALIVADNVQYSLGNLTNCLELAITPPTNMGDGYNIDTYLNFVQAIVLYQVNEYGGRYAQIVKNVDRLDNGKKLQPWYFYAKYVEKGVV